MSAKIKYTDERLGNLKVVFDFLPRPKNEVLRARKEIRYDLEVSETFVRVLDVRAHKSNPFAFSPIV